MIDDDDNEGRGRYSRRDFLRGAVLAAGVASVSPSSYGQTGKAMPNRYGLYVRLRAQAGRGRELGEIMLKAARLVEGAEGCVLYVVNKAADGPDDIRVMEVWDSKEDHDNSLTLPGVRELIAQAMPLLAGKPEGVTLEVLGGKGVG